MYFLEIQNPNAKPPMRATITISIHIQVAKMLTSFPCKPLFSLQYQTSKFNVYLSRIMRAKLSTVNP